METKNEIEITFANKSSERYPGQYDPMSEKSHSEDVYIPIRKKEDDRLQEFGVRFEGDSHMSDYEYTSDDASDQLNAILAIKNETEENPLAQTQVVKIETPIEVPVVKKEIPKNKSQHVQVVHENTTVDPNADLVVIVSETPIDITLPYFDDKNVSEIQQQLYQSKPIAVKNLTLINHNIKTQGKNTFDNIPSRSKMMLSAGSKRVLSSVGNTWVVL